MADRRKLGRSLKTTGKSKSAADLRSEGPRQQEEILSLLGELQSLAGDSPSHGALIVDIRRELEEELLATRNRSVAEFETQNQRLSLVISDARTRLALEAEDRREREQRVADLTQSNKTLQAQVEDLERSLSSCPTYKSDLAPLRSEYGRNRARMQRLEEELKQYGEREEVLLQMLENAQRSQRFDDSLTMELSASEFDTERDRD